MRKLLSVFVAFCFAGSVPSTFGMCQDELNAEGETPLSHEDQKQIRLFWMKHFSLLDQIDKLFPKKTNAEKVARAIGQNAIASEEFAEAVTKLEGLIRLKLSVKPGLTVISALGLGYMEVDNGEYEPNKVPVFKEDGTMEMVVETKRPPKRVIVEFELDDDAKIGIETTDYKQEYLPPTVQKVLRSMLLVLAASNPYRTHEEVLEFCRTDFMTNYKVLRLYKSVADQVLEQHKSGDRDVFGLWEAAQPASEDEE